MENLYCDESGEVKEIHDESVLVTVVKPSEKGTASKTQEQTQQTLKEDEKQKTEEKLFDAKSAEKLETCKEIASGYCD
ncbi:5140_t:CDS:2 [Paraglomus occultum]|uniref:5140_t:CDS:1 n=1 Tax=Paraglomus occultum TaxID=144539 RepID=A0A9N8Z2W1_9GLOM|nr:5140_t:CDS:2 [Paraglomus occultum]